MEVGGVVTVERAGEEELRAGDLSKHLLWKRNDTLFRGWAVERSDLIMEVSSFQRVLCDIQVSMELNLGLNMCPY